jgi:hypothetical protein
MRLQTCIRTFFYVSLLLSSYLSADPVESAAPVNTEESSLDSIVLNDSTILSDTSNADSTMRDAFISMAGDCRYPTVATQGDTMHLTWIVTEGVNTSVHYKRSSDEGKTWTGALKISSEHSDCHPPTIAVNAGKVHLSWVDYSESVDGELYYTRSLDGGETWEKNRILIADANSSRYPLLYCKGKNVFLIRQDVENKVYFMASYDEGLTWAPEMLLGKVGKHSCYCYPPAIASNGNELLVIWSDLNNDRKGLRLGVNGKNFFRNKNKVVSSIVVRKTTDFGKTWNKPQVLSAILLSMETKEEIDNPVMLGDGSMYSLFWLDRRDLMLGEIYYTRFDSKTVKYPIPGKKVFPIDKRSPKRPSAVFNKEGNISFAWANFFNNESVISFGTIDPSGTPIQAKVDLTSKHGSFHNPVIAKTSSGLLHVIWFAVPKDKNGWSRVFYKTSKDNGLTWETWEPKKGDM